MGGFGVRVSLGGGKAGPISIDAARLLQQKEAPVYGASSACAVLGALAPRRRRWNGTSARRRRWNGISISPRGRRWNGTSNRAATLADLHSLHGALGFLSRRISRAIPHDHRRLAGGSLLDNRTALRRSVLDDVEVCQRGRAKCCKSRSSDQQFNPHELLLFRENKNQLPACLVPSRIQLENFRVVAPAPRPRECPLLHVHTTRRDCVHRLWQAR
jgi:hypothetical protein